MDNPATVAKLKRLAEAGIELVPLTNVATHFVLARNGYAALVRRTNEDDFGQVGCPGLMTDHGLAMLVRRGDRDLYLAKGFERAATPEEVEELRAFGRDLAGALDG